MLFGTFQGLDQDGDGDVDERNFVGFHAGRYPDDGIHPNGVGEALIAGHIGHRLADALTGAHAP
jgi:lysophospholipase L1-like esterase